MDTETTHHRPANVALVIIYHYRFDQNIDVLEKNDQTRWEPGRRNKACKSDRYAVYTSRG